MILSQLDGALERAAAFPALFFPSPLLPPTYLLDSPPLYTFATPKYGGKVCIVRTVSSKGKKESYESVVVSPSTYGTETLVMKCRRETRPTLGK